MEWEVLPQRFLGAAHVGAGAQPEAPGPSRRPAWGSLCAEERLSGACSGHEGAAQLVGADVDSSWT